MIYPLFLIEALKEGFLGILLTLDTLIYSLISSSFKVFMAIAGARLLSSDAYFEIANKVYILIGVLMLFVLSYAILKGIVDPDNASKGDFGPKMIKNVVIAVVGLAVSPVLFNLMYQAQGLILEQDVLGKIFFRIENTDSVTTSGSLDVGDTSVDVNTSVNPDEYVKSIGGAVTAVNLWQAFFYPAEDSGKTADEIVASADGYFLSAVGYGAACAGLIVGAGAAAAIPVVGWAVSALAAGAAVISCAAGISNTYAGIQSSIQLDGDEISLQQAYAMASAGDGFGIFTVFLKNYSEDGEISYLFGISTIAGAFALYAFVSFSIDMGVRAAKLAYLQIIAPIPLVMQVIPKYKKSFDTYIGLVVSTFMEVFIRISVVYVVVYIICHLTDLFASSSLWGSEELNVAERMFALAFLILGIIAFCRKAPEFITNSLGLKKGDMHLGIGKKLADGGLMAASSIVGGGITAGVRNWRNPREGTDFKGRVLSAAAGMGSGLARGAFLNFGPGHKPADTWGQARDIAGNAAQGANDAREKRDAREARHEAARERLRQARAERSAAASDRATKEAAYRAAIGTVDEAARLADLHDAEATLKAKTDALTEARKELRNSGAVWGAVNTAGRRIDAWSTGTVKTVEEEAAIKFGKAMDGLKGKLREEAYQKNDTARVMKQDYDRLKSAPIREYVEGWDEQSANAEFRDRQKRFAEATDTASTSYDMALDGYKNLYQTAKTTLDARKSDVETAKAALQAAQASGNAAAIATAQADLATAKTNHAAAKTAAEAALNDLNIQLESSGYGFKMRMDENTGELALDMSDIKIDRATAMKERDAQLEGLRIAMEAAADGWVQQQAQIKDSNTFRDIQSFITEYGAYINQHASSQIVVGYEKDSHGNIDYSKPIKEALGAVMTKSFGDGVVQSALFNPGADFKAQDAYEIELSGMDSAGRTKVTYKRFEDPSTGAVSYHAYDTNGTDITGTEYRSYTDSEFSQLFQDIREGVTSGKYKKASSKTAVSQAADKGKSSYVYVTNNDLAKKKLIQRQAQEKRGGGGGGHH